MTIRCRKFYLAWFPTLDALGLAISFAAAMFIHHFEIGVARASNFLSLNVTVRDVILGGVIILVWILTLRLSRLYVAREWRALRHAGRVVSATGMAALLMLVIGQAGAIQTVTMPFVLTFWVLASLILVGYRSVTTTVVTLMRSGNRHKLFAVVIGSSKRALHLADRMANQPDLGYTILGYFDDEWQGMEHVRGVHAYLGDIASFHVYIQTHMVDEVIIALPVASLYRKAHEIVECCEKQGILVRCLADLFPTTFTKPVAEMFEGACITTFQAKALEPTPLMIKRAVDIIISGCLLILLSPLFVIIAVLIKLGSPGPVFFVQNRAGLNKRPFRIYKFRTMVMDAEARIGEIAHLNEESGPAFKIRKDPRITAIGAHLRHLSVDELPQLWNVFKGDMSLVGPRPLFDWEYQRIQDNWIKRRFSIRPGLTGLWQVSGRSNLNFDNRIRMDLYYIDNWSLLFDCQLLLKTIPVVLLGKGAT